MVCGGRSGYLFLNKNPLFCLQLLKFRSEVADLCETLRDGDELVTDDFSTRCQCMMAEAQQLESAVSSATLWLVVDVFKETTEPLERLIKVMLSDDKVSILL